MWCDRHTNVLWGRDDAQAAFVRKHMCTVPDRVIVTEETRRQGLAAARGVKSAASA